VVAAALGTERSMPCGWLELDRAAARRLPRIIAATVVMGIAIFGLNVLLGSLFQTSGSPARLAMLALPITTGLAVYAASLQMLGVARLHDLVRAVRHRL
jgi:putative peptidoglycan lipid II flippase